MNRETIKTIAGLLIITAIVVATFLYGNAQRQAQQSRNKNVAKQTTSASPGRSVKASPKPSVKATPTPAPKPSMAPTPAPTKLGGAGGTGSVAGAAAMPTTGPSNVPILGAAALGIIYVVYRRTRQQVVAAIHQR